MPDATAMMLELLLPWFPVVLAGAVGARLLAATPGSGSGSGRGTWLGVTCALFWLVVVQTNVGVPFWSDPVMFASILSGSAAIVGMAHWSERSAGGSKSQRNAGTAARDNDATNPRTDDAAGLEHVANAVARFEDWLESHRADADVWSAFDEFIRNTLFTSCGVTHTRPFRVSGEGSELAPLQSSESTAATRVGSARQGIVGFVTTTGRSYYAEDAAQGELVHKLAADPARRGDGDAPVWCFAIRRGCRTVGVVSVGAFGARRPTLETLRALERLIGQFWFTLSEVCSSRCATTRDPVSGFMTRDAFLDQGRRVVEAAYAVGEPVAVAVIQIEGLRRLLDEGRWALADEVLAEASDALRRRLRPDDLIGRFDDARITLLLRRVDSELGRLIADQFVERLASLPIIQRMIDGDERERGESVHAMRCGVAGSGTSSAPIVKLTAEALRLCGVARRQGVRTVTDLFDDDTGASAPRGTMEEALPR